MDQATWSPRGHGDYDRLKRWLVYSQDAAHVGHIEAVFHPTEEPPSAVGGHYFLAKGVLENVVDFADFAVSIEHEQHTTPHTLSG